MVPIRVEYAQIWLLLLAVIRCYLAGVSQNNEDFRACPGVRCFFTVHNSKTAAGEGFTEMK